MTTRLAATSLAALALAASAAYATQAVVSGTQKPPIGVSLKPARQSAVRGQTLSFGVALKRAGFAGPVRLGVRGLPRGSRARFVLESGGRGSLVPARWSGAILRVRVSGRARLGTRRFSIVAHGGGARVTSRASLQIIRHSRTALRVHASPIVHTMLVGGSYAVAIRIRNGRGFHGRVRLSATGLAKGWRARFSARRLSRVRRTARLRIASGRDSAPAANLIVIRARGRFHGRRFVRYAVIALTVWRSPERPHMPAVVERGVPFRISGDVATQLTPGDSAPLELVLHNPNSRVIAVTRLSVALRRATTAAACDAAANFQLRQYTGPYPLYLRPGSTRLGELVSDAGRWPLLTMLNLPSSQNACKQVGLKLDYSGTAAG